eukprot:scaffold6315_cov116-Cylindrotheca_fusiformis.AAC.5
MPIVPRFELSQTDTEVIVLLFVATIRLDEIEVLLDEDSVLHFYASPYALTLNFATATATAASDDQCCFDTAKAQGIVSAQYDPSKQTIRIPLIKAQKGVHWPNLEMTARLIRPKEIPKQWLYSVTAEDNDNNNDDDDDDGLQSAAEFQETEMDVSKTKFGYGFANLFQNIFTDYCKSGIAQEMLSLKDPEHTEPAQRRILRLEQEEQDFDVERYDYSIDEDDYLYPLVMEFSPTCWWKQQGAESTNSRQHSDKTNKTRSTDDDRGLIESFEKQMNLSPFTSEEQLQLSTIPYPLIPKAILENRDDLLLWCGLLDLLVPYVYDHLTTMGDPTVESAWTITRLSCSLSWLDPPTTTNVQDTLISLTRRMVIYPYWRNIDFCKMVWEHVLCIMEEENGALHLIIKCLLQIRSILEKSEFYYAGNKLFVDPYLFWVQHQNAEEAGVLLRLLASNLRAELKKDRLKEDTNLNIAAYEHLVLGNEGNSDSDTSSVDDEDESESDSDEDDSSSEEDDSSEQDDSEESETKANVHSTVAVQENVISSALLESEERGTRENEIFAIVGNESAGPPPQQQEKSTGEGSEPGGSLLIQVIAD